MTRSGWGLASGLVDGTTDTSMRPAWPAFTASFTPMEIDGVDPFGVPVATVTVSFCPSSEALTPSGRGFWIEYTSSFWSLAYGYLVTLVRSIDLVWPGSNSISAPVNTGGWFSRGVTSIGRTIVATFPSGSVALEPSVTWNEMEAGPK